jgi:hypothetical protein
MAGAAGSEQASARDMNNVLWSATLGYYLREMMTAGFDVTAGPAGSSLFSGNVISAARAHFLSYVRGRGPFPAFRIGSVPYGLLATTSLTHWTGFGTSPLTAYDLVLVASEPAAGALPSFDQVRIGRALHSTNNTLLTALDTGTPIPQTSASCAFAAAGWDGGSQPDLYVVHPVGTASGKIEYSVLSASSSFTSVASQGTTSLPASANYAFAIAKWDADASPDLFAINRQGTAATEIAILSGASQFQTTLFQGATSLPKTDDTWRFAVADWDKDGIPDLCAVQITGAASQHVEVHILSGASQFKTEILHVDTGVPAASPVDMSVADWNGDGILDVILVRRNQLASADMTVTILRGDQGLQHPAPDLIASLPEIDPSPGVHVINFTPDFALAADWDGDGRAELIVIRNEGSTGTGFMAMKVLTSWPILNFPAPSNLPDPNRGARTTVASATANIATDGTTDLVLIQAASQTASASTDLFYRIARGLDACGVPTHFSPDNAASAGPSLTSSLLGAGAATVDLDGDGFRELILYHLDGNAGQTRGSYRIGWKLDADGAVDHWSADVVVPYPGRLLRPPIHLGGSMTLADLDGNGRPDMFVLSAERPAIALLSASFYYIVGKNLDASGQVTGGWGNPIAVPFTLRSSSTLSVAGIAVADIAGNGLSDVIVAYQDIAANGRITWYRIGWNLDQNGVPQGGWSDPFRFPQSDAAPVAGISLAKLSRGGWVSMLRHLAERVRQGVFAAPRVGMSADAEADLLKVLTLHASARKVGIRSVMGPGTLVNLFTFLGSQTLLKPAQTDWITWYQRTQRRSRDFFEWLGEPAWSTARGNAAWMPRLADAVMETTPGVFSQPMVAAEPLSESQALAPFHGIPNYLLWLPDLHPLHLTAADIALDNAPAAVDAAWPLLFYLARHALLIEYAYAAFAIDMSQGKSAPTDDQDPEMIGIIPGAAIRRPWDRLLNTITVAGATTTVWEYLLKSGPVFSTLLAELRTALKRLSALPTAELDRLVTESLDVCSHRVDSWVTSVATRRLQSEMRTSQPNGVYVGGYGWLERVVPIAGSLYTSQAVNGQTVLVPRMGGGYIHAPSASMASAAAVLRNAHMTRGGQTTAYAIDLSSQRARVAREVLDSVRQGVPLAAALGYRVERILDDAGLQKYIDPLRGMFPLVPLKEPASNPSAPTAGRTVLDGLAMRAAWPQFPWSNLPGGSTDKPKLQQLLDAEFGMPDASSATWLDPLDAVADVMTAEAVYQTIRGNKSAAAAALDAMSQGTRPPEPEILRQPRNGIAVTHRVACVFAPSDTALPAWPAPTPRAASDPCLDAWAGLLLGDPALVRCRATARTGAPAVVTDLGEITLSDLALRPLDVLQLARTSSTTGAASELDRRIVWRALNLASGAGEDQIAITYDRDPSWSAATRSFPEILELARSINAMIGRARPLETADLLAPDSATPTIQAAPALDDAIARVHAAARALDDAIAAIDGAMSASPVDPVQLAGALLSLSMFNLAGCVPQSSDAAGLLAQAAAILDTAQKRQSDTAAAIAAMDAASGSDAAGQARTSAQTIFGRDLPFLVAFTPAEANPGELAQALGAQSALLAGTSLPAGEQVRRWMMGSARVRPSLDLWRRVSLYSTALGAAPQAWSVGQLPYQPGDIWVALPASADSLRAGIVSLVLHFTTMPTATAPCSGLLLDEWSEFIPSAAASTAVSFHYPSPHAQAPQTVLLAVPPALGGQWNLQVLLATLNETLDLAHIRATDSTVAGSAAQFLPAALLACNLAGDTVSTDFRHLRNTS